MKSLPRIKFVVSHSGHEIDFSSGSHLASKYFKLVNKIFLKFVCHFQGKINFFSYNVDPPKFACPKKMTI